MFNEEVLILTEGGTAMGMGHIMRCTSLYEEIVKRGKTVRFLINGDGFINLPHITHTMLDYRMLSADIFCGKYIILDSYHTSDVFMQNVAKKAKCLFIDDLGKDYPSGFVINPTFYGIAYKENKDICFLVGKDYVIVRKEFTYGAKTDINKNIDEITVIIGATDILSLTYKIYNGLQDTPIKKNIIIGKGHKDYNAILDIADNKTRVLSDLDAQEVKEVFLHSDLVITAGGQTCNELIALNVPFAVICVISNQEVAVRKMVEEGITLEVNKDNIEDNIGSFINELSYDKRLEFFNAMSKYDFSTGVKNIIDAYFGG